MEERVAKLETQLEKAMSCMKMLTSHLKEHSSQMEQLKSQMEKHASHMEELTLHIGKHTACKEEHSLPMKELSSPLKEHPEASCMEEQSLLAEDLSSKTQLEVSAHTYNMHLVPLYIYIHTESRLNHTYGAYEQMWANWVESGFNPVSSQPFTCTINRMPSLYELSPRQVHN